MLRKTKNTMLHSRFGQLAPIGRCGRYLSSSSPSSCLVGAFNLLVGCSDLSHPSRFSVWHHVLFAVSVDFDDDGNL